MKKFLIGLAIMVAGCTSTDRVVNVNGTLAHELTCRRSVDKCWEEAQTVCGTAGYRVLNRSMSWGDSRLGLIPVYSVVVACW